MTDRAVRNRFTNILAYVPAAAGDDDPGLRRAVAFAREYDASLTLVDVVSEPASAIARVLKPKPKEASAQEHDQLAARLSVRVEALQREGTNAESVVLTGVDYSEIVQLVRRGGFDLVVKTARPDAEDREMKFGALAVRLFRACPCPVWLEQPGTSESLGRVAAAIDPNPRAHDLNHAILRHARSLEDNTGAELHVFHAWTAFGEGLLSHRISQQELDSHIKAAHDQAEADLHEALARLHISVPDERLHLIKGQPDSTLPWFAGRFGTGLIVVGTHERSGVSGWLHRNTGDRILRNIHCSVLAVKPEDITESELQD